jgi:hypothetical protein
MSISDQLTSEQRNEIIVNKMITDTGAKEILKQVEDGEEVLDLEITSSALSTILNTINNEFEHRCLHEAVRLLNTHSIRQSTDDRVPGHEYLIAGLHRARILLHQVSAIWFNVRRWV